ncbi:unnamed protein product [Protopolystoma xenopodis]|uniref:Uncharacterized protein n=1 Tax=Protopolystoma xenopodis TaxID=117903 RepID=A0A3S4ZHP5_9PLAT|nr:unnamed protein product [Protopolystoma xenopodis]
MPRGTLEQKELYRLLEKILRQIDSKESAHALLDYWQVTPEVKKVQCCVVEKSGFEEDTAVGVISPRLTETHLKSPAAQAGLISPPTGRRLQCVHCFSSSCPPAKPGSVPGHLLYRTQRLLASSVLAAEMCAHTSPTLLDDGEQESSH